MKRKLTTAVLTVAAALLCANNLKAQTNSAPTVWGDIKLIGQSVWDNISLTNSSAIVFGEYSLGAKQFGGGILWDVWAVQSPGVKVGTGIGMEYIGAFYGINANVTLQAPTEPFQKLTWTPTWFQKIQLTPNIIAAIETPLSGGGNSNGGIGTLAGGGVGISFVSWNKMFGVIQLPGHFGGGYDYLNRTGAGKFDGGNHVGFLNLTFIPNGW